MKEKPLIFHGQCLPLLQGYKLQRRQLGKGMSEALLLQKKALAPYALQKSKLCR